MLDFSVKQNEIELSFLYSITNINDQDSNNCSVGASIQKPNPLEIIIWC